MKQVVNGKLYDTESAEKIASYSNTGDRGDFRRVYEAIYRTDNGRYFLHGEGGPMSKYAKSAGTGETTGSARIEPLSEKKALAWCEKHGVDGEIVVEEFVDLIEEA